MTEGPVIRRVRHESRFRRLAVQGVEHLTPKMLRVRFGGEELEGFTSLGFDDHIKLAFPSPASDTRPDSSGNHAADSSRQTFRDYTPRRFDAETRHLLIDFVIHDAGPATTWASAARTGQSLEIGGPRGSAIIPIEFDWHLLMGDETALPAIARRLEELPAHTTARVLVEVENESEHLPLESAADLDVIWVHRHNREPGSAEGLLQALRELSFPRGEGFAWVAAESNVARTLRGALTEAHGMRKPWIKAAGYWKRGVAGGRDRLDD